MPSALATLDRAATAETAAISGIASSPATDSYGHSVRPGAFDESIRKRGLSGPSSVKLLQGFSRILVDPDCENLRRELHSYSWPTERLTGKVIPNVNPVGSDDHLIDSLRYAVEDLRPGLASPDDADHDGGVIRLQLWRSPRRDEARWHERGR